jgi:hypothetical protein
MSKKRDGGEGGVVDSFVTVQGCHVVQVTYGIAGRDAVWQQIIRSA